MLERTTNDYRLCPVHVEAMTPTAPDAAADDACLDVSLADPASTPSSTPSSTESGVGVGVGVETRRADEAARYRDLVTPRVREAVTDGARDVASTGMRENVSSHCSHRITLRSEDEAKTVFGRAVDSLLDVTHWGEGLSPLSADFTLYSASGTQAVGRGATEGDFIEIDLPGCPTGSWVRVESVSIEDDRVSIRVRPSYDPTERPLQTDVTAHFFDSSATNTLMLERRGNRVRFSVEGRGETPNVRRESGDWAAPIMNRLTTMGAWGTAQFGLQHRQWDELTRSVLERAR